MKKIREDFAKIRTIIYIVFFIAAIIGFLWELAGHFHASNNSIVRNKIEMLQNKEAIKLNKQKIDMLTFDMNKNSIHLSFILDKKGIKK